MCFQHSRSDCCASPFRAVRLQACWPLPPCPVNRLPCQPPCPRLPPCPSLPLRQLTANITCFALLTSMMLKQRKALIKMDGVGKALVNMHDVLIDLQVRR